MKHSKSEGEFIPDSLYSAIVDRLPIASVDAIIVMNKNLLLMKRNNNPAKGEWWFPGGRIHRGEPLEEALRREIREETGLELSSYKLISVYSRIFPERHDITIAYLCKCKKGKVTLNNEHSEYQFFKHVPENLHPYVQEALQQAKLKRLFCK